MPVEISTDQGQALQLLALILVFFYPRGKKKDSLQFLIDFSWKFTRFSQFKICSLISPSLSYPFALKMKPCFVSVQDDDCIISARQKLQFARGVLVKNDTDYLWGGKKKKKGKNGENK